jgi:hypothetical protein
VLRRCTGSLQNEHCSSTAPPASPGVPFTSKALNNAPLISKLNSVAPTQPFSLANGRFGPRRGQPAKVYKPLIPSSLQALQEPNITLEARCCHVCLLRLAAMRRRSFGVMFGSSFFIDGHCLSLTLRKNSAVDSVKGAYQIVTVCYLLYPMVYGIRCKVLSVNRTHLRATRYVKLSGCLGLL